MKTVFFVNEKGGVGKSTAAWNAAFEVAALDRRVLLVDADKQRTLSLIPFAPGCDPFECASAEPVRLADAAAVTLSDIATGRGLDPEAGFARTRFDGIDMVCADRDCWKLGDEDLVDVLCRIIAAAEGAYDYVMVDFRRDFGSVLAIMAGRGLEGVRAVVPVRSDSQFDEGVGCVARDLGSLCDFRVLFTQVYRVNDGTLSINDGAIIDVLENDFPNVRRFGALVRFTPKVPEATHFGQPVGMHVPGHKVAAEYRQVAKELVEWCERGAA